MEQQWVLAQGADGLSFGERLEDLIKNSGKTAKAIAEDIGVRASTLSTYIKDGNRSVPRSDIFRELAEYFDVSYEYLYGEVRAKRRENVSISKTYGFSDKTAVMLENMQKQDGSGADKYTQRMVELFNALFENGFADLLLDAVLFEKEMEFLKEDAIDEMQIGLFVGNHYKNRWPGTAIVPHDDYFNVIIMKLQEGFKEILIKAMKETVTKPRQQQENK